MNKILDEKPSAALLEFVELCAELTPQFDPTLGLSIIDNLIRKRDKKSYDSAVLAPTMDRLEKRWYDSLSRGIPDYSVYADPYYFCDLWLCWITYSRKYLRDISSINSMRGRSVVQATGTARSVLDLGCGAGYTTAALKQLYPAARVCGTNFPGSLQYALASKMGEKYKFEITGAPKEKVDLIYATEYFEHQQDPLLHLAAVLKTCQPQYLIIANTFNSPSIGHFDWYNHMGVAYPGRLIGLEFNRMLKVVGYQKIKTSCWNNRPSFWRLM